MTWLRRFARWLLRRLIGPSPDHPDDGPNFPPVGR
jgi:hypothetical protein